MSFDAKDYPFSDILSKAVYSIPRNQRRYVWKQDNWKELLEDVVTVANTQGRPHFMGSIVLKDDGKKDGLSYYIIIDGQQRLTTITILLLSVLLLFYENEMIDDYLGTLQYIVPKNNKNQSKNIIWSEYHTTLNNLISGIESISDFNTINEYIVQNTSSKRRDKIITDALKFFYNDIKNSEEYKSDSKEYLLKIRNAVIEMIAVRIVSSNEEDSYTIFEILNARGQVLEDHELLKNYIMRHIQPEEKRDDAKKTWEEIETLLGTSIKRFIKHYTTHRFGTTKSKESPYRIIQKNTKGKDIALLLKDIRLKASYYEKFISPSATGDNPNCSELENEIFTFFKKKKSEQFRPILLSVIHQYELEKISQTEYENTLKYIYNFFVCYNVIGMENSNKLEDIVYKHAKILEDNYSKENLKVLTTSLKNKIPSFEWFKNAFNNIGWSNKDNIFAGEKNKTRVQTILEIVEKFISQRNIIDEFTIEHVLPDSDGLENALIGNLIPLEEKLNKRCDKKEMHEKSKIYKESNFRTARNVSQRIENEVFNVKKRTDFLAQLIYNNILELDQYEYNDWSH